MKPLLLAVLSFVLLLGTSFGQSARDRKADCVDPTPHKIEAREDYSPQAQKCGRARRHDYDYAPDCRRCCCDRPNVTLGFDPCELISSPSLDRDTRERDADARPRPSCRCPKEGRRLDFTNP